MKWMTLLLLIPALCQAEKLDIIAGCWSYHTDRESGYNEVNKCLGVNYKGYTVMTYHNSEGGESYVLARDFERNWTESLSYGAKVGIVTGYERNRVLPALMPYVSARVGKFAIDFHAIPTVVYTVGFRMEIDI